MVVANAVPKILDTPCILNVYFYFTFDYLSLDETLDKYEISYICTLISNINEQQQGMFTGTISRLNNSF
mgnify:CR=1 FL=1